MAEFSSYREQSRIAWGAEPRPGENQIDVDRRTVTDRNLEGLRTGCLQRIADATELMAKNHAQLIRDRDMYEHLYKKRNSNAKIV